MEFDIRQIASIIVVAICILCLIGAACSAATLKISPYGFGHYDRSSRRIHRQFQLVFPDEKISQN